MCIYCGTTKYRRIYENHYGPIPKEENGRSYHIHHIDGNHSNNDPINLKAVTIKEHYDIHYSQGDWGACFLLAQIMHIGVEKLTELNRQQNRRRIEEGSHNFLGGDIQRATQQRKIENGTHHFLDGEFSRSVQRKRIEGGTHNFLGGKIQTRQNLERVAKGTHPFLGGELQRKRVEAGTHNFLGCGDRNREIQLKKVAEGTHPSQIKKLCPHCNKSVGTPQYANWHGDKCKFKK
jgi:hypothetical protein